MAIRDLESYANHAWQWDKVLGGCFGKTNISPSDLDGIVERNGKFLVLEAKSPRGTMSIGQKRLLHALGRLEEFTVVIVWGEKHDVEKMQVITKDGMRFYRKATVDDFRRVVKCWYEFADSGCVQSI